MAQNKPIKINPNKTTNIEFDVNVNGLDDITPRVRLNLVDIFGGISWIIECTNTDGHSYKATIPKFNFDTPTECEFFVEVIVNEYFFSPTKGKILFVKSPKISMAVKEDCSSASISEFKIEEESITMDVDKILSEKVSPISNILPMAAEKPKMISEFNNEISEQNHILLDKFELFVKSLKS